MSTKVVGELSNHTHRVGRWVYLMQVILTTRDEETWYSSVTETIWHPWSFMFSPLMLGSPVIRDLQKLGRVYLGRVFQKQQGGLDDVRNKELTIQRFQEHIEEVKATIPPERLLVFQVKDGWEPLCRFLNKPIPDCPFPKVNEKKEMQRMIVISNVVGALFFAATGLVLIGCPYILVDCTILHKICSPR